MRVKVSFLVDNRCGGNKLEREHGFSCLLEVDDFKLLIDMGETDLFLKNAKKMKVDLDSVKNAVITHGHYDHGGGASHLREKDIYVHRRAFQKRFKPPFKHWGIKDETFALENMDKNNFIFVENNVRLNDKVWLLANIPMVHPFEKGYYGILENNERDLIEDEISVAVVTDKGLVVISGCAHRGICNTVDYAKTVTGVSHVHAVVGGFHLGMITKQWDETAEETLEYFKTNRVDSLIMAHCNIDEVITEFKKQLPDVVKTVFVGSCFVL
ncbi:MAG: MBL fold metallo-hydrolase [Firmicutes bacterium]|nr:MBL fold metallo-hydrolase [Bacillota bacterium]